MGSATIATEAEGEDRDDGKKGETEEGKGEKKREILTNEVRPIYYAFCYNSYRSHERALLHT